MDHIRCFVEGRIVKLNGQAVSPQASQKITNHSPDGFCWGYAGSGPAQLALALLLAKARELGLPDGAAQVNYQDFKFEVVAHWPIDMDIAAEVDLREYLVPWADIGVAILAAAAALMMGDCLLHCMNITH